MTHYFRPNKYRLGKKQVISFVYKGVTLEFVTYSSLFSGNKIDLGTKLLLEHAIIVEEGTVLDIGCGYGVIGISLAKAYPKLQIYMVDINPVAVKIAKYNARLNGVEERVKVLQGNVYEPVKGMIFDMIISNPPISAGKEIVEEIIIGSIEHLKKGGYAEFVLARGANYYISKLNTRKDIEVVKNISRKGYTILIFRRK